MGNYYSRPEDYEHLIHQTIASNEGKVGEVYAIKYHIERGSNIHYVYNNKFHYFFKIVYNFFHENYDNWDSLIQINILPHLPGHVGSTYCRAEWGNAPIPLPICSREEIEIMFENALLRYGISRASLLTSTISLHNFHLDIYNFNGEVSYSLCYTGETISNNAATIMRCTLPSQLLLGALTVKICDAVESELFLTGETPINIDAKYENCLQDIKLHRPSIVVKISNPDRKTFAFAVCEISNCERVLFNTQIEALEHIYIILSS